MDESGWVHSHDLFGRDLRPPDFSKALKLLDRLAQVAVYRQAPRREMVPALW